MPINKTLIWPRDHTQHHQYLIIFVRCRHFHYAGIEAELAVVAESFLPQHLLERNGNLLQAAFKGGPLRVAVSKLKSIYKLRSRNERAHTNFITLPACPMCSYLVP
jgi:hypothetical protein